MNQILGEHTGRDPALIAVDTERDYYMSAEEAKAYGIVDRVASRRKLAKPLADASEGVSEAARKNGRDAGRPGQDEPAPSLSVGR